MLPDLAYLLMFLAGVVFLHVPFHQQAVGALACGSIWPSFRSHLLVGAFCLNVRTLAFCRLMGFPLNH